MIYTEVKRDLFSMSDNYYFAHCISSDYGMGRCIAVPMAKKFKLHAKLKNYEKTFGKIIHPDCILIDLVFNLITKRKYSGKPSYRTITESLKIMKKIVIENNIKKIAMPKIGCGLDRLSWEKVRLIIQEIFEDVENLEIVACSI